MAEDINPELLLKILSAINYQDPRPVLLEEVESLRHFDGQLIARHIQYLAAHGFVLAGRTFTFDFHPTAEITLEGQRFLRKHID